MVDEVYKVLQTLINKEQNGYVSPEEFNLLAHNVQQRIFRGYFEDENTDKIKENRGGTNRGYANLAFNQRQRINQFSEISPLTYVVGTTSFTLPTDIYFIEDNGITSPNGAVIEEVQRTHTAFVHRSSLAAPSSAYPTYERYSDRVIVSPDTITTGVTCRYLRMPKMPKWTYTALANGTTLFNPTISDFQDFELHSSEFSNIVVQMLTEFGLNIRETEVVQVAETLKNQQNAKDNS